ncbi:Zn-ribbon containing protein [uncultured archaeon]|nr:Zn-ribbon containing protein [uncultured archaeon]
MPYACNVCGAVYVEGSEGLQRVMKHGACRCGKRFLMYLRPGSAEVAKWEKNYQRMRDMQDSADAGGKEELNEVAAAINGKKEPSSEPFAPQPKEDARPVIEPLVEPKDTLDWLGKELSRVKGVGVPVKLSIETIRILEEGKYDIDVSSLMGGNPVIVRIEEGVYYIDLHDAMRQKKGKKK